MNRRLSESSHRHQYVDNRSHQPFTYSTEVPTLPKKQIQYDTDAITQSRSFQILQDWISESEKTVRPSTSTTTDSFDGTTNQLRTSFSSLPSRSFRHLQEQYKDQQPALIKSNSTPTNPNNDDTSHSKSSGLRCSTDSHTPSRAFRYLQEQLPINRSLTVNNRNDLAEIYNKAPPSIREREPEAPRYRGSAIPSRSFRFLQKMTEENGDSPEPKMTRSCSLVPSSTARPSDSFQRMNSFDLPTHRSFQEDRDDSPIN